MYHEIRGERKYNIDTSRLNNLKKLALAGNNARYAEIYQGASYYLLEEAFSYLQKMNAPDGFIDMGSGKGRAMAVAAYYGFTKIRGIDFAEELCAEARDNCAQITAAFPGTDWQVIHGNAADYTPPKDLHVFFFFNPFKMPVMKQALHHIARSTAASPRRIFVVYVNPQLKSLFDDAGYVERLHIKKMDFVEAIIYEKSL